ncbi:uncharacterized protein LOC113349562 isoform X2 [Papaver somniferum]|uniref:uncharacterized protein LOC113349562 isoform X2 n=1 Tax=Papaver somniferum TaxID=3469 RepID=UPI000E6FFEDC|nr:uncharacterized protein LOC113349562 isoform X2 [Papaver somniferum]
MASILNQSTVSGHGDDVSHYQHGIPGIPTDGKVVLLKNSKLGSEAYLVGTNHISKHSAETVKKVINYVRPDVVAVELCAGRATDMNHNREYVTLFDLLCRSMSAPRGLRMKFGRFAMGFSQRQMHADDKIPGLEFKVAVEEASRVGARCSLIDQDVNLILEKVAKASSWKVIWDSLRTDGYQDTEYTRSYVKKEMKHRMESSVLTGRNRSIFLPCCAILP